MRNNFFGKQLVIIMALSVAMLSACESAQQQEEQQGKQDGSSKKVESDKTAGQPKATDSSEKDASDESIAALITVQELDKLLKSNEAGVKLVEPGKELSDFNIGHVPTAQFIHWVDDMTDSEETSKYKNPGAKQFGELMSRLGISNSDRIIIYDRMNSRLSTRLFWTLKYFGHEKVQILDGGFESWKTKFALSPKTTKPTASTYTIAATKDEILAQMDFIKEKLKDPSTRLIDGRPPAQYTGEQAGKVFHTHQEHPRKGHIPGAISIFWKDNFKDDGTFKSAEELKTLYKDAGILPDNCVITYCNEGLHAAPPWFVLTQILDYDTVRLYDHSMAEWANSDQPMAIKLEKGENK